MSIPSKGLCSTGGGCEAPRESPSCILHQRCVEQQPMTPQGAQKCDSRHLPPGVTKPPKKVKHPVEGIGVLEEIDDKEGLATYDFPSTLMEVCISCTMCA